MTTVTERFQQAIDRFDDANRAEPSLATLHYVQRMTNWLEKLVPDASEALRLAVRSHHLRRWMFPRDRYPMTRPGYHQWRTAAARFHADEAGKILQDLGYDDATISRVGSLLRKENLKLDPETQTLEDSACLAFLEQGFADFAAKHDEAKIIGIVQRTWKKMSASGQAAALTIELEPEARKLVEKALM
jgi:hypothetical protein